jgi:P27 family predicted phage terminase small subunit
MRADRDYNPLPAPITNLIPEPPQHLTELARSYYLSVCRTLIDMKILSNADYIVIVQLAQTLEVNERSYTEMSLIGDGYKQTSSTGFETYSAAFQVWEKTSKTIRDLTGLLGLSPAARERIKMKPEEKIENDLVKILEQ